MDEDRPIDKRRCAAMVKEGIYDPESKEGIDFCVNYCPYEYCVALEHRQTQKQLRTKGRIRVAKMLRNKGVSVDDIALLLGVHIRNVQRYLKK